MTSVGTDTASGSANRTRPFVRSFCSAAAAAVEGTERTRACRSAMSESTRAPAPVAASSIWALDALALKPTTRRTSPLPPTASAGLAETVASVPAATLSSVQANTWGRAARRRSMGWPLRLGPREMDPAFSKLTCCELRVKSR